MGFYQFHILQIGMTQNVVSFKKHLLKKKKKIQMNLINHINNA